MKQQSDNQIEVEKWLALRKEAGRKIDPETAEVLWDYGVIGDPYGTDPELQEECYNVGREYFARSPGSDIWVWFGDLPTATHDALWEKHKARLAFPAGLPDYGRFGNCEPTKSLKCLLHRADEKIARAAVSELDEWCERWKGRKEFDDLFHFIAKERIKILRPT